MSSDNKELSALISLLDDPDDGVYTQIRDELTSFGPDAIPLLEATWEGNSFGVVFQQRVEDVIHSIQYDHTFHALKQWCKEGTDDLLTASILISKYQYPDLEEDKIISFIDQLQQDVWLELNDQLTAYEKVRVINHVLFQTHGFSGNKKNYHAPQNSYINNVIESKKGNPLSLCVLYSIIAQRLDIPIYGVNMPKHFVLAYLDELPGEDASEEPRVLFYINPFSRGAVFGKEEIKDFLKQLDIEPINKFYRPCSNIDIVKRVFSNLIYSYEKLGYPDKVEELEQLSKAIKPISES